MKDHAAECVRLTRRAAALLAGTLALNLLAGCADSGSQPVVTDDDLTPNSAVQAALSLEAGNGKTYAYYWPAEDPEAAAEAKRQDDEESLQTRLAQGVLTQEQADARRQAYEQGTLEQIAVWQKERQLDPVVSPQEAANRAGWLAEELYGLDMSQTEIELRCAEEYDLAAGQASGRLLWTATNRKGPTLFYCLQDATTGEWLSTSYSPQQEELDRAWSTPAVSCFTLNGPVSESLLGEWHTDDPAFEQTVARIQEQARAALSGSMLVDGAAVTGIELVYPEGHPMDVLEFRVTCDNGKTCHLSAVRETQAYPEYDHDGYLMRGYGFEKDTIYYLG
ncbi:MAG: hypothetical protein NC311_19375 [Muribaculaceae bacterium]|nr:hypothetical protein [Muribaculaceae bacterium]